jgi:putative ABC transport system substrate-binding protein
MKIKITVLTLSAMLFTLCSSAEAQQQNKAPRIGYLGGISPSSNPARIAAFRQGLRELGYIEGKNIVIEWRHHEGNIDRLPALAAELARLKVDIIITVGPPAARAAKEATVTIPIVMVQVGDPVGSARAGVDCSAVGASRCRRFRGSIRCDKQATPRWTLRAHRFGANDC